MNSVWITSSAVVIGAILTAWVSTRDLALRRKLESAEMLEKLIDKIDNQKRDTGLNPQFALMYVLVEFAISDRTLRSPTRSLLTRIADDTEHYGPSGLSSEAKVASEKLTRETKRTYRLTRWFRN